MTAALHLVSALERPDLLAAPVLDVLRSLPDATTAQVAEIDPDLADTAALTEHYGLALGSSANCVVVTGKRAGEQRWAGCVALASTRVDVNGAVKRRLDVRKASFAAQDDAVALSGMQYGGITPIGLPRQWPVLVDRAVADSTTVIVGSGLRCSKLLVSGALLATLPGVEVADFAH